MLANKEQKGPHGGALVNTLEGFIEIILFESHGTAQLRLYILDVWGKSTQLIDPHKIKALVNYQDKKSQTFTFKTQQEFLEANNNLELSSPVTAVELEITENDHSHKYCHYFSAKTKEIETNEIGIKTLKKTLVILVITACIQLSIVLASTSAALLADTIHNFSNVFSSIPLLIAFIVSKRAPNRRFNYGYGKSEDVAGAIIILLILASAGIAAFVTLHSLAHPVPMQNLGWVAAAAIVGFLGNEVVAIYRIRVGKVIGSVAMIADGYHARGDGLTSLAVLLGVIATWLGFPIADTVVGIFITGAILFMVKNTAQSVWIRLNDGIEAEILTQIEHAPVHVLGVIGVPEVRARWIGHRIYAEVTIYVEPALTVSAAHEIVQKVEHAILVQVGVLNNVTVRIQPSIQ